MEIEYIERLKICVEETIGKKLKVTIYDNTPTFATANLSHFQSGLGRIWGISMS